jgi:4-hydroxy-3-methylbut-2-enyl diphosphate reductase IspH
VIVVGAPNSARTRSGCVEVAERAGCPKALLIQRAHEIDWADFEGIRTLGVTAGASAPQVLVDEIIDAFRARYRCNGRDRGRLPTKTCSSRCRASCADDRRGRAAE